MNTTHAPGSAPIRPDKETYFLLLAFAARARADCLGRHVGAVLSREGRVLGTGYNGTPFGVPNCSEGGCYRCSQRASNHGMKGGSYDVCICVHAEQNAILTAARFGQQTLGAAMTSTLQPCFGCLKEMLQAGISECYYYGEWNPLDAYDDPVFAEQYEALAARFTVFQQIGPLDHDPIDLFQQYIAPQEARTLKSTSR